MIVILGSQIVESQSRNRIRYLSGLHSLATIPLKRIRDTSPRTRWNLCSFDPFYVLQQLPTYFTRWCRNDARILHRSHLPFLFELCIGRDNSCEDYSVLASTVYIL